MARSRCRVGWWEFSPPVVEVSRLPVLDLRHHLPMRHCVTAELVGDRHPRYPALRGQQFAEEPLGGLGIPAGLDQDVEHVAVLVDGPPQVVDRAVDAGEDFVEVPFVAGSGLTAAQARTRVRTWRTTADRLWDV